MLLDRIQHIFTTNPSKLALSWRQERVSYGELFERILEKATYFSQYSANYWVINHTSPIQNCVDWFALMAVGKVGILAPKELQDDYFSFLQNHSEIAFCSDYTYTTSPKPDDSSLKTFEDFFKPTTQTIFLGVLSSGSSGTPKLIWKDYQSWFSAFPYQSDVFGISSEDHLMVLDALSYSANANAALHMLWAGGSVTFVELNKAKKWGECIGEKGITSIFMVPSHLQILAQQITQSAAVTSVVTAGEKLSIPLAKALLQCFTKAKVTEYYGAAELGHIAYQQGEDLVKNPFSVGCLFPNVEVEIIEQEIHVSSPYVSPLYRQSMSTVGDIGEWEGDKLLILGRGGRVFNRRGINIFAQEIETIAQSFLGVKDVVLLEHKVRGISKLVLYFSTTSSFSFAPQFTHELQQFLLQKLPKSKCPSFLKWVEEIPKTPSGKIDYQEASHRFPSVNEDDYNIRY